MILAEDHLAIKEAAILRIGRSEDEGIDPEYKPIPNIPKYKQLFLKCFEVYNLKKELKL